MSTRLRRRTHRETREVNPIKIAFLEMERGLIELIPDEDDTGPPPTSAGYDE